MSLYHEAADLLTAPNNTGGSLKSRVFNSKSLKSAPAQVFALIIETCKWSFILKEVIEHAGLLRLEKKLTPVLSLLLVHDLLLAKKGIALPATHGLRAAVERHKARLQAELTKSRVARKLGSLDGLTQYVDAGEEGASKNELQPPRWIRINTLKTQLEDQLDTTFASFEAVQSIDAVRQRGTQRLYIDQHVPNLVAVSPLVDLSKSKAYTSGEIIFQDKASCFPAYMLDPLAEDGDIIDSCAAPGNKTTHVAAILQSHTPDAENHVQTIHAFEKDKTRSETLRKMVDVAGSHDLIKIHAGKDFLQVDPNSPEYSKVGALILDPSCSGSGIIGRDDLPEFHLPAIDHSANTAPKTKSSERRNLKRRRDLVGDDKEKISPLPLLDDNENPTPITSPSDLHARLTLLSAFQLSLIEHAMAFPSARKITYSTCSIHYIENESVVSRALKSDIAQKRGWRILRREQQVRGLREWNIRGSFPEKPADRNGDVDEDRNKNYNDNGNDSSDSEEKVENETAKEIVDACIRSNKGDQHGTMGFFLAGFVRDAQSPIDEAAAGIVRDEKGFIVRDLLGIPIASARDMWGTEYGSVEDMDSEEWGGQQEQEQEWTGFNDGDQEGEENEDKNVPKAYEDVLAPAQMVSPENPQAADGDGGTGGAKINARSIKSRKRKRKGKAGTRG